MINGFVHLIESPGAQDLLAGRTEGRVLGNAFGLAGIPHTYNLVTNVETLVASLRPRLSAAMDHYKSMPPMLHFSMHGDKEGIGLTDGSVLNWDDLRTTLAPLNDSMNRNYGHGLLITMSTCEGASGCRMAMHELEHGDFWALVGNCSDVKWNDAAVAYVTFYHLMFKGGRTLDQCVGAMKIASGDDSFVSFQGEQIKASWKEFVAKDRASRQESSAAMVRELEGHPPLLGGLGQAFQHASPQGGWEAFSSGGDNHGLLSDALQPAEQVDETKP